MSSMDKLEPGPGRDALDSRKAGLHASDRHLLVPSGVLVAGECSPIHRGNLMTHCASTGASYQCHTRQLYPYELITSKNAGLGS